MRDETKRAGESLAVAVVVGVFHLGFLSGRFATEQGSGGVTLLLGCTFTTGLLWTMLALRTIANDGKPGPEIDDGLTCMAVTAWVMALVPPRASNFLAEHPTDDFTWVYVPLCLFTVFAMLAAQKLWPAREPKFIFVRLAASSAVSALVVAGCVLLAGGETAMRASIQACVVAVVGAVVFGVARKI
ncbi:MAG: hypothetical protein QM817_28440 [Archangium sp.]